jgi:hypothetical protein
MPTASLIDLPDYIAARTNLSRRLVRDAINARYISVGREIVTDPRWPAEKVRKEKIVIDFPKFVLKPESDRVEYPRGVRGATEA